MGGFGASRICMQQADVFGALYMMSPCCMSPRPADQIDPKALSKLEAIEAPGDAADLSFMEKATLATAAAWSPDTKNPPLYLDLPTKNGVIQPEVLANWTANAQIGRAYA